MIFKQETIKSWFTGVGNSINNEVVQPFQNANNIISKYNSAIQHNSLTQQGWQRLLAQSDDGLKAYLTSIKGTTASMSGYNVSLQGNIAGFTKITKAMQQYNALRATSQKEQQAFAAAVGVSNTKLGSYLTGLNGAKASLSGYGLSLIASTAKTIGLTVATTALNATLTMGISLIVSGLISAFVSWIHKSEEITEKAQEAADKINLINGSLKSNTETVENAKKRYAELAQKVENLGKITQSQGTLNNEEYEEFLDLSNQLAGIFPSLTKNYDDNGNAILDLSGNVNTIIGSLDSLIQKEKELANQKIMEEFPDVFKGWNQNLSDAEQKVKSTKTEFDKINNAYQQLSKGSAVQAFEDYGNGVLKGFFLDENGEKIPIYYQEYIQAAKDLGLAIEETQLFLPNQFGGKDYKGIKVELTGDIDTAFTSKLEKAREDLQYAQQQLEGQTSSINQYLNTWLQGEFSYIQIEDSGLQTAIQDLLFNFEWDNIQEDKRGDWNYVSEYLRRNILFEINKVQDDPVISKAISEVFTNTELTPDEKSNYLQQIKDFFGEDSAVVISLKPQIEETETLQKQYDKVIEDTKKKFSGYDPTVFFKEHSINTQEEIDVWQEIAQTARTAAQAEKEYLNQIETSAPALSIPDTITQLNTRLKPALDSLQSIYQNIFADDKFDLNNIDLLSACDSVKSKLDEMSEAGLNVDYSSYEKFVRVLQNSESTPQAVKDAFDSLASSITSAALSGTEDFGTMKAALETLGAADSEMDALKALAGNKEALRQAGLNLADATDAQIAAFVNERISAENASQAIDLLRFHKELCALQDMNTAGEVANLKTLAENAGYTGEVIQYLTELEQIYQEVARGGLSSDDFGIKMSRAAKLQTLIQDAAGKVAYEPPEKTNTDNGPGASFPSSAKEIQKEADTLADLNSQMDKLQSSYKSLCDIRDTYNKSGKITIDQYQELTDMGFNFLANLLDENGELGLNANAFEQLAGAKLQEMQIQMARNAIDTISGIRSETEATEYLTYANENLRNAALSSTEALLYQAQAAARMRGEQQGLAADRIVQGYEAAKMLAGKAEFGFDASDMKETLLDAYNEQKKLLDHMKAMGEISNAQYQKRLMDLAENYFDGKEEYRDNLWEVQEQYHDYLESVKKTYRWIENLLDSLSKKTGSLIDKAEKFISRLKKNSMINRKKEAPLQNWLIFPASLSELRKS